MNRIIITGRAASEPQTRQTQSGKTVVSFTLAVNRRFDREKADFIPCTAWGALADNISKYVQKGQEIHVCGELQTRNYEDKNGNKRTAFEVNCDEVEFGAKSGNKKDNTGVESEMTQIFDDDKLPFD